MNCCPLFLRRKGLSLATMTHFWPVLLTTLIRLQMKLCLKQTYDHEGKSKEAGALKRTLDHLIADRVNLVINRLEERRSHLANSSDPDVELYEIRQDLYVMYDDVNLACQNNDAEQIKIKYF